jgi:hypothetical protein
MKKIKKQPSVRSERSETSVSQVGYVLLYGRLSSYFSADGKKLKQPPASSEMSVTSVSRVRYILWYEPHGSCRRTTEKNEKQPSPRPPSPPCPPCPAGRSKALCFPLVFRDASAIVCRSGCDPTFGLRP